MKRIICICASAMFLCSGAVLAQGQMDAYKFSQRDLNGTARYLGMGGAFGALGGDISAMESNPAGLGIYRSSEIVTTLSLSSINADANWGGTKLEQSKTRFNFDNIGYIGYFPTGNDEGLVSWNVGFAYNRVKSFNRKYHMGRGAGGNSLSDYIAAYSNLSVDPTTGKALTGADIWSTETYNPYTSQDWLPTLGYNAGITDYYSNSFHSSYIDTDGKYLNVQTADMLVNERGAIDKYDFSLAANVSNVFFIGATVSVTDMTYRKDSYYDETFSNSSADQPSTFTNNLIWNNNLKTTGTGYGVNVGMILRPNDYFRIGVAYNSPTWYKLTNRYKANAQTNVYDYYKSIENPLDADDTNLSWKAETPTDFFTEYRLHSADRWIFSAAAILGQYGLLSIDYELNGYKNMRLLDRDGNKMTGDNDDIKSNFRYGNTIKIGGEARVTPQFSVRAGVSLSDSPLKSEVLDNVTEIYPTGTNTNYTLDRHVNYYTVGLGYRFTPNFYMDMAYVYKEQKEDAFAYSSIVNNGTVVLESSPATLKTNTSKVALTLGYKF